MDEYQENVTTLIPEEVEVMPPTRTRHSGVLYGCLGAGFILGIALGAAMIIRKRRKNKKDDAVVVEATEE